MPPQQVKSLRVKRHEHNMKCANTEQDVIEKHNGLAAVASYEASDMDEAMLLVGVERSAVFSEEYNLRLRRKLVSFVKFVRNEYVGYPLIHHSAGPCHYTLMRGSVFYTVLVSGCYSGLEARCDILLTCTPFIEIRQP